MRALYVIQRVYTPAVYRCLQPVGLIKHRRAQPVCGAQCERVRVVARGWSLLKPGVVVVVVVVVRGYFVSTAIEKYKAREGA